MARRWGSWFPTHAAMKLRHEWGTPGFVDGVVLVMQVPFGLSGSAVDLRGCGAALFAAQLQLADVDVVVGSGKE
jgi:hypothetical protein